MLGNRAAATRQAVSGAAAKVAATGQVLNGGARCAAKERDMSYEIGSLPVTLNRRRSTMVVFTQGDDGEAGPRQVWLHMDEDVDILVDADRLPALIGALQAANDRLP